MRNCRIKTKKYFVSVCFKTFDPIMPSGRRRDTERRVSNLALQNADIGEAQEHARKFEEKRKEQVLKFRLWATQEKNVPSDLPWLDEEFCQLCMDSSLIRHYSILLKQNEQLEMENSNLKAAEKDARDKKHFAFKKLREVNDSNVSLQKVVQGLEVHREQFIKECREKLLSSEASCREMGLALKKSQDRTDEMKKAFDQCIQAHEQKVQGYKEGYERAMDCERRLCRKLQSLEEEILKFQEISQSAMLLHSWFGCLHCNVVSLLQDFGSAMAKRQTLMSMPQNGSTLRDWFGNVTTLLQDFGSAMAKRQTFMPNLQSGSPMRDWFGWLRRTFSPF
tara:strand:+ start:4091 stop:5095 length:1005 start_codon:yes stop_codon:yes gene_type:complete